jgi:hypothetical protein
MAFEDREIGFRSSVNWWTIGFRFGLGFYCATALFGALVYGGWLLASGTRLHTGLNQATQGIEHAWDSIPKPALPKPPKVHAPHVDPKDKETCLKLSGGVLNEQYIECMQENATDPAP